MKKPKWEDITSYRQGEEKVPHWWSADLNGIRLSVGDKHLAYPEGGVWFIRCDPWFNLRTLKAKTESEAKREALGMVRDKLHNALATLMGLLEDR